MPFVVCLFHALGRRILDFWSRQEHQVETFHSSLWGLTMFQPSESHSYFTECQNFTFSILIMFVTYLQKRRQLSFKNFFKKREKLSLVQAATLKHKGCRQWGEGGAQKRPPEGRSWKQGPGWSQNLLDAS